MSDHVLVGAMMSMTILCKMISSHSTMVVAIVLSIGLGWVGATAAQEPVAQTDAFLATTAAVAKLGPRFGVKADEALAQFVLVLLLSKNTIDGTQQALLDTLAALEHSNAENNLAAPPVPTGDALFDRYALAVDKRLTTVPGADIDSMQDLAAIGDAELAQWEGEFGQDERYWELRYLCAKDGSPQAPLAAGFAKPSDFLDEARKRGIATANTLLVRYQELRQANDEELQPLGPPMKQQEVSHEGEVIGSFAVVDWDAWNAEPLSERNRKTQAAVTIMQRQEQEQLALLNAAVAAGPNEAWTHYMRAFYWFELGEQDKGLDDLDAGNAKMAITFPAPWPLNYIRSSPLQSAPVGNAAVSGAIYLMHTGNPTPSDEELGDAIESSLACINLDGDPRPLEIWHQFVCRYGQRDLHSSMYGIMWDTQLRDFVEKDQAETVAPPQIETFQRCRGASQVLWNALRDAPLYLYSDSMVVTPFAGKRGLAVGGYLAMCSDLYGTVVGDLPKVFQDLSQVHFPDLAVPECMRKYEALSEKEVHRRNTERNMKSKQERKVQAAAAKAQAGEDSQ